MSAHIEKHVEDDLKLTSLNDDFAMNVMTSKLMRAVLARHREQLKFVFDFYARVDNSLGKRPGEQPTEERLSKKFCSAPNDVCAINFRQFQGARNNAGDILMYDHAKIQGMLGAGDCVRCVVAQLCGKVSIKSAGDSFCLTPNEAGHTYTDHQKAVAAASNKIGPNLQAFLDQGLVWQAKGCKLGQ